MKLAGLRFVLRIIVKTLRKRMNLNRIGSVPSPLHPFVPRAFATQSEAGVADLYEAGLPGSAGVVVPNLKH